MKPRRQGDPGGAVGLEELAPVGATNPTAG